MDFYQTRITKGASLLAASGDKLTNSSVKAEIFESTGDSDLRRGHFMFLLEWVPVLWAHAHECVIAFSFMLIHKLTLGGINKPKMCRRKVQLRKQSSAHLRPD